MRNKQCNQTSKHKKRNSIKEMNYFKCHVPKNSNGEELNKILVRILMRNLDFTLIDSTEQGKKNCLETFVWRKSAKYGKLTFLFEVGGSVMGSERSRSQVGA